MLSNRFRHWTRGLFVAAVLVSCVNFTQVPAGLAQSRLDDGNDEGLKDAKRDEISKILEVLNKITSRDLESIDSQSRYPKDWFVGLLSEENIQILDHFGVNVASHLFEYCVVVNRALNELTGDEMRRAQSSSVSSFLIKNGKI